MRRRPLRLLSLRSSTFSVVKGFLGAEEVITVSSIRWTTFYVQVTLSITRRPLKRTAQIVGIAKVFTISNGLVKVSIGKTQARDIPWDQFVPLGTTF